MEHTRDYGVVKRDSLKLSEKELVLLSGKAQQGYIL